MPGDLRRSGTHALRCTALDDAPANAQPPRMTLVVGIGLGNYYQFDDDPEGVRLGLRSLVEGGYTTLVREVFPGPAGSDDLADARVLEVARTAAGVEDRWLAGAGARKLLDTLAATYASHTTYASFVWSQLDRLPAYDVQPLALVLDGDVRPDQKGIVLPGVDQRLRVRDLDVSIRNWSARDAQSKIAAALHRVAKKLRLVVHSG